MDNPLPYRIETDCYYVGEDDEIERYRNLVLACAEGNLSPSAAAQEITDTLAEQAKQNKEDIDLYNKEQPYSVSTDLVATMIGSVASSFPPFRPAHDRVFSLLAAFPSVETRLVPNSNLDRNMEVRLAHKDHEHLLDTRTSVPLWDSLEKLHIEQNFQMLAESGQRHWTGVEKCGSQEQQRWRNLSFFCAKLTAAGIADLSYISALFMLLPERRIKTSLPGWSGYLAGQALAAAQWIIPESHGAWVWQACRKITRLNNDEMPPRRKWNLEYWELWKSAFWEVLERTDDERIHGDVRREAAKALKIMTSLEKH